MKNSQNKKKSSKPACPYCTKEIAADAIQCPWCGTSYGSQTLKLLKSFVRESSLEVKKERRKHDRVPRKFKITYPSPQALINSYLSNISLGGVFIKTKHPLDPGARFILKIFLPDGGKELEVNCEVAWIRTEEKETPKEKLPPGMGIKFLDLSPEGKKRINQILRQTKG
ncbi:MAG: hypothetical protein DRG25_02305 [Deltaproteobacteria bacterium]|nr:MAG: hypothetical protein DRG25_02305 [Deltaproteobacteria bacterium]